MRQFAKSRTACPSAGAIIGTRIKTAITKDMIRAMARPSY